MEKYLDVGVNKGDMMMDTVLYESKNSISYIYFNREDQYNALNQEMLEELLAVVEKAEESDDQIVVLGGKGKAFCAGGDRKSTRLNSSHVAISYAVFCLKKKSSSCSSSLF